MDAGDGFFYFDAVNLVCKLGEYIPVKTFQVLKSLRMKSTRILIGTQLESFAVGDDGLFQLRKNNHAPDGRLCCSDQHAMITTCVRSGNGATRITADAVRFQPFEVAREIVRFQVVLLKRTHYSCRLGCINFATRPVQPV